MLVCSLITLVWEVVGRSTPWGTGVCPSFPWSCWSSSAASVAANQSGPRVTGACQCLLCWSGPTWLFMAAWRIKVPLCVVLGYHTAPTVGLTSANCQSPRPSGAQHWDLAEGAGRHLPPLTHVLVNQALWMTITWPIPGAMPQKLTTVLWLQT